MSDFETKFKAFKRKHQEKPSLMEKNLKGAKWVWETVTSPVQENIKHFNVGVAQMLGLPGTLGQMVDEDHVLPSGETVQEKMSKVGMTYSPDKTPDTLAGRTWQNIGAGATVLPAVIASGADATMAIGTELAASAGAAFGGKGTEKFFEETEWGRSHPNAARAIGEVAGGILAPSPATFGRIPKQLINAVPSTHLYRLLTRSFRGKRAVKRAAQEIKGRATDPKNALRRLQQTQPTDQLTPFQRTGDEGVLGIGKSVEKTSPSMREYGAKQRSKALISLKKLMFKDTGEVDVGVTRAFMNKAFKGLVEDAQAEFKRLEKVGDPEATSRITHDILNKAVRIWRGQEKKIWSSLKEGEKFNPKNTVNYFKKEMDNITEGGDIRQVSKFVRRKLGSKAGIKGEMLKNEDDVITPKALHQFYSVLGNELSDLATQAGTGNKMRIIKNMREAVLKDLESSPAYFDNPSYKDAIGFSRELNTKFVSSKIGQALGFQRGEASDATLFLDDIIKGSDEASKLAVDDLFKAAPYVKDQVKTFIKQRFAAATIPSDSKAVNRIRGTDFLKKHNRLLKGFPDLRKELQDVIYKQKNVDDWLGAGTASELSPLIKEQSAASLYLNSEVGQELKHVISTGSKRGKTKAFFKELVNKTKKDKTGDAYNGLKASFSEELINHSGKQKVKDVFSEQPFLDGDKYIKKLRELKKPLLESGFLNNQEYQNLEKIGRSFQRLEKDLLTKGDGGTIMSDTPGSLLEMVARFTGAKVGSAVSGAGAGAQIQIAGMFSGVGKKLANFLTKDEARELLIKAYKDKDTLEMLLKTADEIDVVGKDKFWKLFKENTGKLLKKTKKQMKEGGEEFKRPTPVSAVAPPAITMGREDISFEGRFKKFRSKYGK